MKIPMPAKTIYYETVKNNNEMVQTQLTTICMAIDEAIEKFEFFITLEEKLLEPVAEILKLQGYYIADEHLSTPIISWKHCKL